MTASSAENTASCDVVVVGSGLAGLAAALYADGRSVTVLSKSGFGRGGSSPHAQGGVAVAWADDDSPEQHAADTMAVSGSLANAEVTRLVTSEGPGRVAELLRLGAQLDRDPSGHLALGREAAHSRRRVAHAAGDATGAELVRTLATAVTESDRIELKDRILALDLLVDDGRIAGVLAADESGRVVTFAAPAVVLATGGCGRLFEHTTNSVESTGDGIAMAARAGARLVDLEFVQFHPTALADGSDPMALLTEALRGEGAKLIDDDGKRFMVPLHPGAELAPRDVVARSIWRLEAAGGHAFLDATSLAERLDQRFPTVMRLCRERGLDPRSQPIPASPAAHYHMGGVEVDTHGHTSIDGLYACGEVAATGLHGANRLASNSLLEALVFGDRVGEALSGSLAAPPAHHRRRRPGGRPQLPWRRLDRDTARLRAELRRVMWRHVGLERDAAGLRQALEELDRLHHAQRGRPGELANMLLSARLVATAALAREESRGSHFRSDFRSTEPRWCRHLVFEGERLPPPASLGGRA